MSRQNLYVWGTVLLFLMSVPGAYVLKLVARAPSDERSTHVRIEELVDAQRELARINNGSPWANRVPDIAGGLRPGL